MEYRNELIKISLKLTEVYLHRASVKNALDAQHNAAEARRIELLAACDWASLGKNEQQREVSIALILSNDANWRAYTAEMESDRSELARIDAEVSGLEGLASAYRSAIREMQTRAIAPALFEAIDEKASEPAAHPNGIAVPQSDENIPF